MSDLSAPTLLRGVGALCVLQIAWEVETGAPGHRCLARSGAETLLRAASDSAVPPVGRGTALPPAESEVARCLRWKETQAPLPASRPPLDQGVYTEERGGCDLQSLSRVLANQLWIPLLLANRK